MNTDDISKEILSEIEKDKIIAFMEDNVSFNAVKKYLLAVVYKQGVIEKGAEHKGTVNFALNLAWGSTQPNGTPRSDEELGQNLRAMTYAVQLIESGFRELGEFKKPEKVVELKDNPAE